MFGFGPMSSFYDEDFEDDNSRGYNPVEPFSQDEFIAHNDRELRNLDAGRDDWDDGDDDEDDDEDWFSTPCPRCNNMVDFKDSAEFARCKKCGNKFSV